MLHEARDGPETFDGRICGGTVKRRLITLETRLSTALVGNRSTSLALALTIHHISRTPTRIELAPIEKRVGALV